MKKQDSIRVFSSPVPLNETNNDWELLAICSENNCLHYELVSEKRKVLVYCGSIAQAQSIVNTSRYIN